MSQTIEETGAQNAAPRDRLVRKVAQARLRFANPERGLVGFALDREELDLVELALGLTVPDTRAPYVEPELRPLGKRQPLKLVDSRITCPACGDHQTSLVAETETDDGRGVNTWRCDSVAHIGPQGQWLDEGRPVPCGHTWNQKRLPIGGAAILVYLNPMGAPAAFLMELREDMGDGPMWLFPAGKIEGDETAGDAFVRECQEELDMIPRGYQALTPIAHPIAPRGVEARYTLLPFLVTDWESPRGMPQQTDVGATLAWKMVEELERHPHPAIRDMVREAMSIIRNRERGL